MTRAAAIQEVQAYLAASDLTWERTAESTFVVTLPGERKLLTTTALSVGEHALTINAFVARNPDENHEAVYRWLLERNRRTYGVAFAVDHLGDIYLVGRVPLSSVSADELDRLLGSVLEYSDGSFNTLLELGFATSIQREWRWRKERGLSTDNLNAFEHLVEHGHPGET
ncbi:MAG TPA: YbjN domain-containing protein [Actinobacteria bacterium]|jgi:Putative bacterial sensory transduction regulator|nr:YbjN domain-containing protein [Actinomycetota bacterium]